MFSGFRVRGSGFHGRGFAVRVFAVGVRCSGSPVARLEFVVSGSGFSRYGVLEVPERGFGL